MTLLPPLLEFDVAPYRLSGVVYLKPRNTLSVNGATIAIPDDAPELEVGAALGIVIGQTASRVSPVQALQHVAGYTIVNDISVPHDVFYRPSIRFKARDEFCPVGPVVVPRAAIADPDDLATRVYVDGELKQQTTTGQRHRGVAHLPAAQPNWMPYSRLIQI